MSIKQSKKCVFIYLSPEEYIKFTSDQANSTCRNLSEYGRKLLTGRSVTLFYRNRSFDEFMHEAILLRKELQKLLEQPSFGKSSEGSLLALVEQIKLSINKIADICLQK